MYHCILQAARECIIHTHRYPRVRMYVYVYKYTYALPSCPTYTHAHTYAYRLRKTEEYFGFKKKRKNGGEEREMELAWRDVGSCKRARLHFPNFRKEILHSRARLSHETRGTYILFGAYCIRQTYHRRVSTFAYTHTHTHPRYHVRVSSTRRSETVHRRAITRACKSRNYNASRGENARVIRLIFRFSLPPLFFASRVRSGKWKCKRKGKN